MISVIIPTLNAEAGLGATLAALVPAAVEGLVGDVIIADGGSTDHTREIADACGATVLSTTPGRGQQMLAGAAVARGTWLLFLHADTVLDEGWIGEVIGFQKRQTEGGQPSAAAFTFALDDQGIAPRVVEAGVRLRSSLLKLPYGDQGLLISRALYQAIGGHGDLAIMEDVDIVRRLGRSRIQMLRTRAVTSALRYRERGYLARIGRNVMCLAMFTLGVPIATIHRFYR